MGKNETIHKRDSYIVGIQVVKGVPNLIIPLFLLQKKK